MQKITKPTGPIIIGDLLNATSLVTLEHRRADRAQEKFLVLADGEFSHVISTARGNSTLTRTHRWGKDDEGSSVYDFYAVFSDMQLHSCYDSLITLSGWMTQMSMYLPEKDPFVAASDKGSETRFEYTPPKTQIVGYEFPIPILMEFINPATFEDSFLQEMHDTWTQ